MRPAPSTRPQATLPLRESDSSARVRGSARGGRPGCRFGLEAARRGSLSAISRRDPGCEAPRLPRKSPGIEGIPFCPSAAALVAELASDLVRPLKEPTRGAYASTHRAKVRVMAEVDISRLDLGASDAESDRRLGEYFVTTPYVEEALSGRRTLFLGRKGSGKSALFRQFPPLVAEAGRELSVVPITPDNYAWRALKDYRERGLSNQAAHRTAWKLTLAVQIASALVEVNYRSRIAEDAAAALREFSSRTSVSPG